MHPLRNRPHQEKVPKPAGCQTNTGWKNNNRAPSLVKQVTERRSDDDKPSSNWRGLAEQMEHLFGV